METFHYYKGYGIKYRSIGGTTFVTDMGSILRKFKGMGCIGGEKEARKYIDQIAI